MRVDADLPEMRSVSRRQHGDRAADPVADEGATSVRGELHRVRLHACRRLPDDGAALDVDGIERVVEIPGGEDAKVVRRDGEAGDPDVALVDRPFAKIVKPAGVGIECEAVYAALRGGRDVERTRIRRERDAVERARKRRASHDRTAARV